MADVGMKEHDTRVCHDDEARRKLTSPRSAPEGKELVCYPSYIIPTNHLMKYTARIESASSMSSKSCVQFKRRELTQTTRW